MNAAQLIALILFGIAAVLTAVSWAQPIDIRVPVLLTALAGALLALDAGGVIAS